MYGVEGGQFGCLGNAPGTAGSWRWLQPDDWTGQGGDRADTERRDLYRPPTSPAELGLPTPPLGVLVPKQDKGRKKAKKIAA